MRPTSHEVKAYGRSDSVVRTPEQTQTVLFWAENTFVQLSRTVRLLAEDASSMFVSRRGCWGSCTSPRPTR